MKRIRLIQVGVFVLFLATLGYFSLHWFTKSPSLSPVMEERDNAKNRISKQPAEEKGAPFQGQDPWSVFHNKMVDLAIEGFRKAGVRMTPEDIESVRAQLVAQHETLRAAGEEVPKVPKFLEVITKVSRGELHKGPQTVESIMETFDAMHSESTPLAEVDMKYPRAKWIQRCLDRGVVFEDYGDYSGFLSMRHEVIDYENNPNSDLNMEMKKYYGLPPEASLEEYTNAAIDGTRRDLTAMKAAEHEDPAVSGGFGTPNGFIPMRQGVLYVKVDEKGFGANFYGDPISEEEKEDLLFHGIAPRGLEVIYLDEDDKPLSLDVRPKLDLANYDLSDEVWEAMAQNMSDEDWEVMGIERDRLLEIRAARKETQATTKTVEQTQTEALESVIQSDSEMSADLEKQLTPEKPTDESIETQLREQLSPERFDKARRLIDQYGTAEGLRRLREMDPEAARQFERGRRPSRDVPDGKQSESGSKD